MLCHLAYAQGRWEQGLDHAVKAFELQSSQAPMQRIITVGRNPALTDRVTKICTNYLDDFTNNQDQYAADDAYHSRMIAALHAAAFLRQVARNRGDTERVDFYNQKYNEYRQLQERLLHSKRW
jgi:hypothetical protein